MHGFTVFHCNNNHSPPPSLQACPAGAEARMAGGRGRVAVGWTSSVRLFALLSAALWVLPSEAQSALQLGRVLERRQAEQLPPVLPPEPSCAQLKLMWRQMHRMARHSQLTNEIPQFPAAYPFGYVSPDDKALMYWTPSSFGKVMRQPGGRSPQRKPMAGRFAEAPLPRAALGPSYGTMVHSPDERAALQRIRKPAGTWGRFPAGSSTAPNTVSKTRLLYRVEQVKSWAGGEGILARKRVLLSQLVEHWEQTY
ncbi:hypothetical protein HPB48_010899 [Haemaphysalis longicornis]|uniref:Uncharacterized protein n=1 Tax=Haemaphysalis longicornis TaxID=44386 RepID=A0A9J6H4U0_HAELO|nr:hypothetical protein HPB48_010899 [Haemaphysalis longicornis]